MPVSTVANIASPLDSKLSIGSVRGVYGIVPSVPYTASAIIQAISELFTAAKPGAWYDPSDFSTLYQESTGVTPVTAVEQTTGLVLDKRLGLVRGPELVTNGGFDSDIGWTKSTGVTISGGALNFSGVAGDTGASQSTVLVAGKTYEITISCTSYTAGNVYLLMNDNALAGGVFIPQAGVTRHIVFVAGVNTTSAMYLSCAGLTLTASFDNISVKLLDGNHLTQATAAARPLVSARVNLLTKSEDFANAAWNKVGATTAPSANTINFPNVSEAIYQAYTISPAVGATFTGSATLSGSGTMIISIARITGAAYEETATSITLNATPTRYTVNHTVVNAGQTSFALILSRGAGTATTVTATGAQLELSSTATRYQRVNTATDYDTVGFPTYEKFDGVDDSLTSSTGGGATAGFFLCQAVKPTGGAGTVRHLWSDASADKGYRVRLTAANKLELSAGNNTPLIAPVQAAASTATTGGTGLAASTAYFYVVTATNAAGESLKSNEVTVTTGLGATNSNTLSWAASAGATSYTVYRGTATGVNNAYYTLTNVLTYVDTGAASTAGSPPTVSETAYIKATSVASVDVGTTALLTTWQETRGRVNLLTYSEDFSNAVWGKEAVTVSGTNLVVEAATSAYHRLNNGSFVFVIGTRYTISFEVAYAGRYFVVNASATLGCSAVFNLQAGTVNNTVGSGGSIVALANGRYRCIVTGVSVGMGQFYPGLSSSGADASYVGDGVSGVYIYSAQLETGSTATTYQRVGSATDFDTVLLNAQIGSGAVAQIGMTAISAGTAGYTVGKANGSASNFFIGNIYPEVYRTGTPISASERANIQAYVRGKAGL